MTSVLLFVAALIVLHYAVKRKNIGLFALFLLIIYLLVNGTSDKPKDWK